MCFPVRVMGANIDIELTIGYKSGEANLVN